jgi:hypothetical protein
MTSNVLAAVEKLAAERREYAANEQYIYLHAVNDYMSAARQRLSEEEADKLEAQLYRKYGL